MNARNLLYIKPSTTKRALRILDNKLLTKEVLKKNDLPTPETFGTISSARQLAEFEWDKLQSSFALKPNRGFGGEGIIIVFSKKERWLAGVKKTGFFRFINSFTKRLPEYVWIKADGSVISLPDLKEHILNIIDGTFSLGSAPDIAFFEERIKILKLFKNFSFKGVPDIRVIVYNSIPVMAELRLPTKESGGKANLHLGAVGAGIDMGSGTTTYAIHHDHAISYIPGSRYSPRGIKIPDWQDILELAIRAQRVVNCGFLGVDISIDREKGPTILELNARPGLAIQLANMAPLRERMERVKGLDITSPKKGVKIAQDLFGGTLQEELEEFSGKKIVGAREEIVIYGANQEKYTTIARVDTGAYRTAIAKTLAEKLGITSILKYKNVRGALGNEERPIVDLVFELAKTKIRTEAFIASREEMKHEVIIGRRDLKKFLVDPTKNVLFKK